MLQWMAQYWLETVFGLLVALFTFLYRRLSKRVKRIGTVELGVQALLRDRIVQAYNHYSDKGYCPIYGRQNVEALYTQYRALGGNGTVKDLVDKLSRLPTEKEEG